MTNVLKVNHEMKTLVMDKTFEKNSSIFGSRESLMLEEARRAYPNYTVARKQIKKNTNQEHYNGLTYKYMRWYIETHEKGEALTKALAEYDELLLMYESRNNYYNKIFEELDGSTENKLRAVFEEYINILLQNSVEKKFLPFHENSALNIFDINKMTRCQLEAKHFYASFDKLFGQSLSKAISYLDSIQADWDEFKKMREEQ